MVPRPIPSTRLIVSNVPRSRRIRSMAATTTPSESSTTPAKPTVGILSIGDMGVGVARLLRHHEHAVYTVGAGRSRHTLDRIRAAQITSLDNDAELVAESDIILSIVPPRDAIATARRALEACQSPAAIKRRKERTPLSLTYVDLNAISPRSSKTIAALFTDPPASPSVAPRRTSISQVLSFHRQDSRPEESTLDPISVDYLDGGIIGGPPSLRPDQTWKKPSIVVSGPNHSGLLPADLIETLNVRIVGDDIGAASALKACFASLSKGAIALSILSFTTAHSAGVLPALEQHLAEFNPAALAAARAGLTSMPPKAYRWVDEMRQINETFVDQGGFSPAVMGQAGAAVDKVHDDHHHAASPKGESGGGGVFDHVADIYRLVADDTLLGEEKTESRKRGTDVLDVVECIRDGIHRKKTKLDSTEDDNLDLTWRGSWS